MEKLKKIIANLLLIFVILSIGYIFGKNSIKDQAAPKTTFAAGNYVAVCYFHATIRCASCNTIESLTDKVLTDQYSQDLTNQKIRWYKFDYQKNSDLAKSFEVVSSCLVIAIVEDGEIKEYQRLDEVWTKLDKPILFNHYVSSALDSYLKKSEMDK